jgi:hypothetical protein
MRGTETSAMVETKEVPLVVKVRRRIEDRLRKDEQAVMMVAEMLKVKTTE